MINPVWIPVGNASNYNITSVLSLTSSDWLIYIYGVHYNSATGQYIPVRTELNKANKNGTYLNFASGQLNKTNQYLQNLGYNVYGFEPYSYFGNDNTIITSFQQLQSYKFDGIFANNTIEHLQNPIQDMAFLRSLLKPNGALTQTTGCYSYRYDFTCFHFFYFIGESLKILSQKAGYIDLIKLDYNPAIENEGYLFRNGN